jgi:hypothetical protein
LVWTRRVVEGVAANEGAGLHPATADAALGVPTD